MLNACFKWKMENIQDNFQFLILQFSMNFQFSNSANKYGLEERPFFVRSSNGLLSYYIQCYLPIASRIKVFENWKLKHWKLIEN